MALKPDRKTIEEDISLSCLAISDRGYVLCYSTAGSGVGIGSSAGYVDRFANPSGKTPAGVLMHDVVSLDLTRYHLNFHKEVMASGSPVAILKKGRVTTNAYTGTPTPGATAYLTSNGTLTPTVSTTGGTAQTPKVGQFVTGPDADSYVTVDINLPVV
jgi:hypothetical protein